MFVTPLQHERVGRIATAANRVLLDPQKGADRPPRLPTLNLTLPTPVSGLTVRLAVASPKQPLPVGQHDLGHGLGQKTPRPLTRPRPAVRMSTCSVSVSAAPVSPDERFALPPESLRAAALGSVPSVPFAEMLADQFRGGVQQKGQEKQEHCT